MRLLTGHALCLQETCTQGKAQRIHAESDVWKWWMRYPYPAYPGMVSPNGYVNSGVGLET